jgi:type IV secretion system pilin
MRLTDRSQTATTRPHGTRPNGHSPAAPYSIASNVMPESVHREAVKAPMIRTGRRRSIRALLIVELVALGLVLTASSAHADVVVLAIADSVTTVLDNIRNWLMGILAGLATVFLSIGGVRYVMGGGDPGEVEKAKTAFKSAGWGYALAALAPLVVEILKGIVGA